MRDFQNLDAFVRHLQTLPEACKKAEHDAMEAAAGIVQNEAKDMIGRDDVGWVSLADATVAFKQLHGYTNRISATDSLLRTGEMRASIQKQVEGNEAVIGSDDEVAEWQELGTPRIPARSFLGGAVYRKTDVIVDAIGLNVTYALAGNPRPNRPLGGDDAI